MTSQRSHVMTMWFSAFSDVFCAGLAQVFSLWRLKPTHMIIECSLILCFFKFYCSYSLSQEQSIEPSLWTSLALLVWVFFASFSTVMESTPSTSKRIKTRAVRSGGRLEGWFSGDNELIERYRFETSTKVINNAKVVSFDWLKSQKLDNVRKLLKDQSLRRFLEMKGNIYPDLIRVFYTNLKFEGNNFASHVKGVDMEITHDVWTVVAGLKYVGLRINKGNLGVVEDFNKVQYYKSCLKNQNA